MPRRLHILPVLLLAALLGARAAGGAPYTVATVAWIGWSPLHVAEEKGFWRDLDLYVQVRDYDDPIVILEAIKAGRIDFAMDMVGSLVGVYMRGEPVVALAETDWSHGGDKIIVHRGERLADHVGGLIGVFLHQPSCLYFLGRHLATAGLRLDDFRIVEINPRDLSAQFIAHRLPVILNYAPWADAAVTQGDGRVLATSADYPGCIPECLFGYRRHMAKIPPADIRRLLRGWIAAVEWIAAPENRDAYFAILRQRTFKGNHGLTDEDLHRMRQSVVLHLPAALRDRNRDGGGLEQFLVSLRSFLKDNDRLERDFAPRELFDNRYILQVLDEMQGETR